MKGHRFAILIGNGRYSDQSGLADLRCPQADVEGLARVLGSDAHGPYELTTLVDADRDAILLAVYQKLSTATKTDTVLVYYSGHGKLDAVGSLYLAARNTHTKSLPPTAIPIEEVKKYIHLSRCGAVFLVLDCCFSGAVGRGFKGSESDQASAALADSAKQGEGVFILTASTDIQVAEEKEGDTYSLLTKFLVKGIDEGEADLDHDGFVSVHELVNYVRDSVSKEGGQQPRSWMLNAGRADVIIAKSGKIPLDKTRNEIRQTMYELGQSGYVPDDVLLRAVAILNGDLSRRIGTQTVKEIIQSLGAKRSDRAAFVRELYEIAGTDSAPNVFRIALGRTRNVVRSVLMAAKNVLPGPKILVPTLVVLVGLFALLTWRFQTGLRFRQFGEWTAAEVGSLPQQTKFAEQYGLCKSDTTFDINQAFSWYRRAARAGDADSAYYLGKWYVWGVGTERDKVEGEKWLRTALNRGNKRAEDAIRLFFNYGPVRPPPTLPPGVKSEEITVQRTPIINEAEYLQGLEDEKRGNYAGAIVQYDLAIQRGYQLARTNLARILECDRPGSSQDLWKSFSLYLSQAQAGYTDAQIMAGLYLENGWGVQKNQQEARKWYERAKSLGTDDAEYRLNHLLITASAWVYDGPEPFFQRDFQETTAAAKANPVEQAHLAWLYASGRGTTADLKLAAFWYRRAADRGNLDALYRLGLLYKTDELRNPALMASCFCQASLRGYSLAELQMAELHRSGFAATEDFEEGQRWTRRAAEKGLVDAQLMMWEYAGGTPERFIWLRKAAAAGSLIGMEFLAHDLMEEDEKATKAEAFKWWIEAAKSGSGVAQLALGDLYREGDDDLDVRPDLVQARKWYTLAATGSTDKAPDAKHRLEKLTSDH
jgi:TPR repeat protein